jgi:hypothetical protein
MYALSFICRLQIEERCNIKDTGIFGVTHANTTVPEYILASANS